VFLFFFLLLCIGLNIFRDYGVHWDEYHNQTFGSRWENYISSVLHAKSLSTPLPEYHPHDLIHGPIFEILLSSLTNVLGLKDSRDIIIMRHLSIFLLFYIGTIFFYLLCLCRFKSWKLALLGCVFLVLSPRIFADAFYNTVDIAFMVFFVISIFTLLLVLDKKNFLSIAVHALTCAILINIRLIGLILPIFTIIFFCLEFVYADLRQDKIAGLKFFVIYVFLLPLLTVILNPFLWLHPLGNFICLINSVKNFTVPRYDFYFGKYRLLSKQPWHYAPVWMAVTTPLIYTALFCVGCFDAIKLFFKNTPAPYSIKRNTTILLLWLFLPLMMTKGRIYDGWRQIYFIYPAFLIVALIGTRYIWGGIVKLSFKRTSKIMQVAFIILLVFSFFDTAIFMIRNHPYQNLYFNALVGKNIDDAKKNFTLDYWGLSYRKALEYILKNDRNARIPISVSDPGVGTINANILSYKDRKRIIFDPINKSKYFLTNDMQNPYPHDYNEEYYGNEYYSIKVDGMKIMVIYKLNPGNGK